MSGIAGRFGPDSGRFLPQIPVKSGNFRPEYSPWGVAVYGRNWWQVWSGISSRTTFMAILRRTDIFVAK